VPNSVHSEGRGIRRRLRLFGAVVAVLLVALLARLWYLQVLATGRYTQLAVGNRVREMVIPAPRGVILDRVGRVLAGNRASWAVTVDADDLGAGAARERVLDRLARLLHVTRARIEQRLRGYAGSPYLGAPVAEDVPQQVLFYLAEHAEQFPGVGTQVVLVRDYPNGVAAAHPLGYVGEVSAAQLTQPPTRGRVPATWSARPASSRPTTACCGAATAPSSWRSPPPARSSACWGRPRRFPATTCT
jgi:penicillin-binding protein 2